MARLGDTLVEKELLTRDQLDAALASQAQTYRPLGRILVEGGVLDEVGLATVLAERMGLPFVDLGDMVPDPTALAAVPLGLARRRQAVPLRWEQGRLVVAMADPANVLALDDLRTVSRAEIVPVVATRSAVQQAIERASGAADDVSVISDEAAAQAQPGEDLARIREVVEDAPIVRLVDLLIIQAVQERASDIHVEPAESDVRIRFRVDGVLHEKMRSPKNLQSALVSRLKIMSDIDIAERRIPQDGRMSVRAQGQALDLRVATLPTVYGEKVVLRVLDTTSALMRLSDLGFFDDTLARYESAFRKPYGMILVTGPTGSGKSTTLYATLSVVNDVGRNIITVEDPVEYRLALAGVNQVQVNVKTGMTFAIALRSILRADPDVVLVGEIRDRETAVIAIEAALTGHLVLSTLHTNDAATTPTRLVEMGVEPFLVASALDCVVAQRLARRLCERCKEPYEPSEEELDAAGWSLDRPPSVIYRAVGCGRCSETGYRGRSAIHEVLLVGDEMERLIVARSHSEDMRKLATAQGMLPLRQAGFRQVARGVTSIAEILRVAT